MLLSLLVLRANIRFEVIIAYVLPYNEKKLYSYHTALYTSCRYLKVGACSRYTDSVKKIFLTDFG